VKKFFGLIFFKKDTALTCFCSQFRGAKQFFLEWIIMKKKLSGQENSCLTMIRKGKKLIGSHFYHVENKERKNKAFFYANFPF